jgi:hypothetical protein
MGPEILLVAIHPSSGNLTVAILRSSSMDRVSMIHTNIPCEHDNKSENS